MKDCAARIDAELEIVNASEGGAFVELLVPARIAYEKQSAGNLPAWLNFLLPGRRSRTDGKDKQNER